MKRGLFFLLLLPGLLLAGIFLAVFFTVLAFLPPVITAVAFAVLAIVGLWLVLGRRGATTVPGTESSLLGRQKSSEGLL